MGGFQELADNEIEMKNEKSLDSIPVLQKRKELLQQRIKDFQFKWWGWCLAFMIGGVIGYIFSNLLSFSYYGDDTEKFLKQQLPAIVIGGFLGLVLYGFGLDLYLSMYRNGLRHIEIKLIQLGAEELQENIEENFFTRLVILLR
jgi:hypothetical protein